MHLLLASFGLPFLLMYAVGAVQMSHNAWFTMKPAVHEQQLSLRAGSDAREVARDVFERAPAIRGELTDIQMTADAISLRVVLPGTVHEIRYDRASGATRVKTSIAGLMGMLNRLHHAAGLSHDYRSMNVSARRSQLSRQRSCCSARRVFTCGSRAARSASRARCCSARI